MQTHVPKFDIVMNKNEYVFMRVSFTYEPNQSSITIVSNNQLAYFSQIFGLILEIGVVRRR